MEKLKELFELCSASVTLIHNEHKDLYLMVDEFLNEQERNMGGPLDIEPEVRKFMIERNHMCTLRAYPDTPIGFYVVYHWDFLAAVDQMLVIVKGGNNG